MAEIVRRRSCGGVLPLGRHASNSGSSVVHCASANIAPPLSKGAKRPQTHPVQARTGLGASDYSYCGQFGGLNSRKENSSHSPPASVLATISGIITQKL